MAGGITLAEIAQHTTMLQVRCGRCPRAGRLSLTRLIALHGPHATIGAVATSLTAACPNRNGSTYQRCDVFCPELPGWFMASRA